MMKKLTPWVGVALVISILSGALYATSQQQQRSAADSPQIQMAQDAAAVINQGSQKLSLTQKVDMASSLSPFENVYDLNGNVVAGSGLLDGQVPKPPIGVLKAAHNKDYSRVTWEPKAGVRIAAVTVATDKYYILSGRSLKEVEKNETATLNIAATAWSASMIVVAATFLFMNKKPRTTKSAKKESE